MKSILIIVDTTSKLNLEITENNTIYDIKQILLSQGFLDSINTENTKQTEMQIRFYINENTKMNDVFYKPDWDKLKLKTIWDKLNNAKIVIEKEKETKEISSIKTRAAKFYDDNMKMLYLDYISANISKEKEHFIDVYTQAMTKIDPNMIHDNQEYLKYMEEITDPVYTAFQLDGKPIREDYKSYIYSNLKVSLFFGI